MLTIHLVWAWLAAINATLPYVSLTAIAYALVYAWRKVHPRSWLWLESRLPFAAELDAGEELAHNIALSLPSVVIGGALAALTTGGSVLPTVLGAVAGAFAPLLHHTRKFLPFDPYQGKVAPVKPKTPLLPLLMVCLSLVGCPSSAGGTHPQVPCDAGDTLDQVALAAHAAECRRLVQGCGTDRDCRNAAIEECDRWGDRRCAEGAAGAGGSE